MDGRVHKEIQVPVGSGQLCVLCGVVEDGQPMWELKSHQLLQSDYGTRSGVIYIYSTKENSVLLLTENGLDKFGQLDNGVGLATINISFVKKIGIDTERTNCSLLVHHIGMIHTSPQLNGLIIFNVQEEPHLRLI